MSVRTWLRGLLAPTLALAACGEGAGAVDGGPCMGACVDDARRDGALDAAVHRDAAAADLGDPHARDLVSIAITPADAMLVAMDGARPTQQFAVSATQRDGSTVAAAGLWSLADPALGGIDANGGLFTSNGLAGGVTRVHVEVAVAGGAPLIAETTLAVSVRRTVLAPGAPADAATRFTGAGASDPARALRVLYPLDGAVLPQNVFPPDVQWEGGSAGDIFRARFVKDHAAVTAYVLHTGAAFNDDYLVDRTAWRTLAESDAGRPFTLAVDRWDHTANEWIPGASRTLTVASGSVSGAVYYWWIDQGTIYTIDGSGNPSTALLPHPPPPPVNNDGSHNEPSNCVGCHSVSRDGRWLAGRLGGSGSVYDNSNGGGVFDLTDSAALAANPARYIPWPAGGVQRWYWSAWNHDSSALMVNSAYLSSGEYRYELRILHMDPRTGQLLRADPSSATAHLPRDNVAMPAWSVDDQLVSYVRYANPVGERPSEFTRSNLEVVRARADGTFGDPVVLHDNGGVDQQIDTTPTFSPDSRWIVYGHGNSGRSNAGSNPASALFLVAPTGGASVRLANANGGATAADAWYPSFSPFNTGGYFWLVFFSPRDYGNARAGSKGTGHRQLWVTAIDNRPGATDPSHVPYWLPGQRTSGQNITAYWAPAACRGNGASCDASSQCCSGNCLPGDGGFTCQPPPASMCRTRGQTCSATSDCCSGMNLQCVGNVCDAPPPG